MSATEEGLNLKADLKFVCAWCEPYRWWEKNVTHGMCDFHAAQFEPKSREYLAKLKGEK